MALNILCIGDVVGKAGRNLLADHLPRMISELSVDLVVCNAENAAGGSGLTPQIFSKLLNYGVDVVTLGDHCFRKGEIVQQMKESDRLIRPANLPPEAAGSGWTVVPTKSDEHKVGVVIVCGQMNMANHNSPWTCVDEVFEEMSDQDVAVRVVEMHAETTSEKVAMGWHCNGRASVVFGTHTHVPTADYEVLDGGTAFISDLGMTGPYDSILGRRKDRVLRFMTTGMPQRFDVAVDDPRSYMLLAKIDERTGKALGVEQIVVHGEAPEGNVDADDMEPSYQRRRQKWADKKR
ncbi:MAG: metallophosphoesterase [Planctomycetes bacterium]|jgi:metallophosphoesterase (TIGR00282 family)|nr:metallophosphoesterase [Planctomycetota bacterium]